ncbi:MAG: type II CRISPR RNA-guided endonuclease Cas9 [Lachnospiraceae bacterium]|nr:type II CRISPR RNA-guided endonuclease Cas9 [Lachnospiraceae bacterium]
MRHKGMYSIGIDIGTGSVGYVVIDENGNVLKIKRKNMMGVRLYEHASSSKANQITPAHQRRNFRNARRRYSRRKERIKFLRGFFYDEIMKIDENFFKRMDEGFLWLEDKSTGQKHTLFNDIHFTDSNYYSNYPTIYHLRQSLCQNNKKEDIRLIYLALHHIIKYRGNFLKEGQSFDYSSNNIIEEFINLKIEFNEKLDMDFKGKDSDFKEIQCILLNKTKVKKEKVEDIVNILVKAGNDRKYVKQLCNFMIGNKADLSIVFKNDELKRSISFTDNKYEEEEDALILMLEEKASILESIKKIFSWYTLQDILQGEQRLCDAMVNKYNKHSEDLKLLKKVFRECSRDGYEKVLKKYGAEKNYVRYILGEKKCTQKELYDTIKKYLKDIEDDRFVNDIEYIKKEMDEFNFLPRLNSKSNSAIPYQLHERELIEILNLQGEFYPFLKENKEKINAILRFKIPYYIGPLYQDMMVENKFSWIERSTEKITPWNWDKGIIDIDKTAEIFIKRMTNKCTYIYEEDVLPKYSLLYSEYILLNELNKIRINGKRIPIEDKKRFVDDLFKKIKNVNNKTFVRHLHKINYCNQNEFEVEGYQKDMGFAGSLASYIDFKRIFGKVDDSNYNMIEKIIYWLTVFEEKDIIKRKIKKEYGDSVTKEQLKKILKLKYKGWGRLSKKLLVGLKVENEKSELVSIMDCLRNSNDNLMQIIESEHSKFKTVINNLNLKKDFVFSEKELLELPCSPSVKRGIWQTFLIIEELTSILGKENLKHIYIEFARGEEEKVRKQSRQKQLEVCYKKLKEDINEYNIHIENELKNKKYLNKLDVEKVYLYFTQNGKCMYSGETLDIDSLSLYHVDHIIPRSLRADDSLDNKVLVCSNYNELKGNDTNFLKENVISKQKIWWKKLYDCKLISTKKYVNLQKSGMSKYETIGFLNRQLVETRQISKRVAEIFNGIYGNETVVTINAVLSTEFRKKFKLAKVREINDYHHAHDAYLAAYIGNKLLGIYDGKFENEFIYSNYVKYRKKALEDKDNRKYRYGYFMNFFKDEDVKKIENVFAYKGLQVTKKLEELDGEFYNQNIIGKKQKKNLIPIKKGLDVDKYGGYSGDNNAYSLVVEYIEKNKVFKKLVGIPVRISYMVKNDEATLYEYLKNELKCDDIRIIKPNVKIKKYQLIEVDGYRMYLVSNNEVINAVQLCFDKDKFKKYMLELSRALDVNKECNENVIDEIYSNLYEKISIHYKDFKNVADRIYDKIDWNKLSIDDKVSVIMEVLKLVQVNPQYPNLSKYGLKDRMGRKSGYTLQVDKTFFIHQSVTGLFERRMKY